MGLRDAYYPLVIASLVIDGIAVGLRLWARSIKKAIGYDDIAMMFSLVGFIIFCAMEVQAIRYDIGATTIEPDFDLTKAAMFFTAAQIVCILTTGISKLAVGLVLFRLANGASMKIVRRALAFSMVIVSLWCLVTALIFGLQCRPLSVAWGVGEGSCLSTAFLGTSGFALSGMDVTISWFYAPLVVSQHKKLLKQHLKEPSILYSEIGLSILAASLTALRPLLKTLTCFRAVSSGNPRRSRAFDSMNTLGNGSYTRGTAYRLDDRNVSDADSQENIISSGLIDSRKETASSSSATTNTSGKDLLISDTRVIRPT
ncbi:hypothetical protein BFJ63_vAg1042 [Fusarium oxysporum f. sp. narcissi]|uniref:Rhodopsin domain-containing protein n=1 Tax=Fusarium oxysporum f. sp. narcissi TaxID=451672 RepID=A0A4Q2WCJ5_FUSOX|nr:hypothetical protein BFJ63_vAg1042 [Fusarium oxysporum f. sp. narcissi]